MKYLALIRNNLLRNKRRTSLTVLSIAVSLFIFSALMSFPTLASELLADTASSVRIITFNKAGFNYLIPVAYRQKIAVMPHVTATVAASWFGGILHEVSDQFPNLAIDHDQADAMWPDWGLTAEQWGQFKKQRTACLIGADTVRRFNLRVGQQIVLKGTLYPFNVTLQIVGVIHSKGQPNALYFRRDYLEEAAGRPGLVGDIWVQADNGDHMAQVIETIDQQFANSSAPTQSESEAAFVRGYLKDYRMLFNLFKVLGAIVVITIGLVAANTSAMSIRERRSEIAVMRSMGFPSKTILFLLLAESFVIGLFAGLLGCGGAFIFLHFFAARAGMGTIRIPPVVLPETLLVAAAIGLLSAWVPARAASRMNIVEALRNVA